ncbi:hypothetical protein IOC44_05565, partial [Vibrio vulnificus]|uniref:hypothetical protein n=1 Tax=Vibrio vulnificus TaxID=672 RepID=UPI0022A96441
MRLTGYRVFDIFTALGRFGLGRLSIKRMGTSLHLRKTARNRKSQRTILKKRPSLQRLRVLKREKRSKLKSLHLSKTAKNRNQPKTILKKRPSLQRLRVLKREKRSKQTNLHLSKTAKNRNQQ